MKKLMLLLIVCLAGSGGCARKVYYYHPDKTSAEIEMDYTRCMHDIDVRLERRNPVSGLLEKCMQSKGYKAVSDKEAKQLGIEMPEIWPPHASKTSSTGP